MFEQPIPGHELLARLMMMHQQASQGGGFAMGTQPAGAPPQGPMMGPGGMPLAMPPNGQPVSPLYTALSGRMPLQGQ